MEIRSTEIKDLPLVMEIYDYARAFMRATGNTTQWIDGYPSEALICQEIEDGHSFVCTGEQGENTYSKVITLEEIKNKVTNTIRVYIKWNNVEENNEEDSKIGLTKDNFISIPVSVSVIQYLGEPVVEYQNE